MISNDGVKLGDVAALEDDRDARDARIAELEVRIDKTRKLADREAADLKRWNLIQSAVVKLKRELGKSLTEEERHLMDGAYIFLHSGCVDIVRTIPSATSRGEDVRFIEMVEKGEALER